MTKFPRCCGTCEYAQPIKNTTLVLYQCLVTLPSCVDSTFLMQAHNGAFCTYWKLCETEEMKMERLRTFHENNDLTKRGEPKE